MISNKHVADLAASSITSETAAAAGLDTHSSRTASVALGWAATDALGDCLALPYRWEYRDGEWRSLDGYTRYRPDTPREIATAGGESRVCKYESPVGQPARIYAPRDTLEWCRLLDSSRPLVITEGEKKALALLQLGLPAIAVPGVWNFATDGVLAPEIEALVRDGRRVVVAYDRDWLTNPQVARAAARLTIALTKLGADVRLYLPPPSVGGKGIDDQIVEVGAALAAKFSSWCRPWEPGQLSAWLSDCARYETREWSRRRLLGELQATGTWFRALNRELGAKVKINFKRWARTFAEEVEPHRLDSKTVLVALNSRSQPESVEATADRPWATVADDFELIHVFGDGSRLPAGTPELLGRGEADLALHLLYRLGRPVVFLRGGYHSYSAGVWSPLETSVLEAELAAWHRTPTALGDEVEISSRLISGTLSTLASILAAPSEEFWSAEERTWLVFANLSVSYDPTVGLVKAAHDPSHRAELAFAGPWTDTPTTEAWSRALADWTALPPHLYQDLTDDERALEQVEKIDTIRWWLGSSLLWGARRTARALALVGGPGTGKSTLCSVLRDLWPEGRTSAIPLQRLSEDYQAAQLSESFLNVTAELPSTDARDVESIKAVITACDAITARNPYGRPFRFVPRASVLIGMNCWPSLRDYSGAIWDRFVSVRLENRFRGTSGEDHDLANRLREESTDIVIDAILTAIQYHESGSRPNPQTSQEELDEARSGSDPVSEWLGENAVLDCDHWTSASALHRNYTDWAGSAGRGPLSSHKLSSALRTRNVPRRRSKHGSEYRVRLASELQ